MKSLLLLLLSLAGMFASSAFAENARSALTYDQLIGSTALKAPVSTTAFVPPADAMPPSNIFEGRLKLTAERGGGFEVLRDAFGDAAVDNGAAKTLPPFDFAFVQSGDALVPVRRGAISSSHSEWEFILEPGRMWDEPGDHGMTRAALPFTLEERNANCMHNGMLTFLFANDGRISDVVYEIASETCFYFKFNMWGRVAAKYVPGKIADANEIHAAYAREVAQRLPTRPIAQLAQDVPGADPAQFGSPKEVPSADMSIYGVVVNGINYVSGCETRFGLYPDCAALDVPSYSLAKTLVGGLATMRLSLLYPGITNEIIGSHVPDCAAAKTWDDVTFGNALDMATGHYLQSGDQADEDAPDLTPFFLADDRVTRVQFACTHYPRKAEPGTKWIYHTADSYLLGEALNSFYRGKTGGDFYNEILARDIWTKLKLSPSIFTTRRTYDAAAQPFTGYGLTLNRDDIAKLANFINVDRGRAGSEQLLDPAMLAAALQQNPSSRGLEASTVDFRYHNGFWAWNAQSYLGCRNSAWIPFMSGYGGNVVALMPNGITYYYFSDSGVWRWAKAAAEANRIKPFCQ